MPVQSSHDNSARPAADVNRGDGPPAVRMWNLPNALCALRMAGVPVLLILALRGETVAFLALLVTLQLTDVLDGILARWLEQQSDLGATLDTVADVSLYAALIPSVWLLKPAVITDEWMLIAATVGSYGVTVVVCLARFRRLPSWHTIMAKVSWGLLVVGLVAALLDWSIWPLRIALISTTLTNIETIAVTFMLSEWRTDVKSIFAVRKRG